MSAVGGTRRCGPGRPRRVRCGSQLRGLALPVELQRRRADDDGRDRRRRPRAPRAPRPSCRGPARRPGTARRGVAARSATPARWKGSSSPPSTAAVSAIGSPSSRASARISLERLVVLGAQLRRASPWPSRRRRRRAGRRKASSGSTIHGSIGSVWPGPTAPGSASKAPATSGSQRTSRRRKVPSTVSLTASRAGGGSSPRSSEAMHAARGAVHARAAAQIGQRLGAALGSAAPAGRRPRARWRPRAAPRAPCPRGCAGPTSRVRRGAWSSRCRPSGARWRPARRRPAALVVSSGKRSSTSATWTPAQSSTGAHHSRVSQSKRRCGMLRTDGDDLRVVGEGEDDDRPAVGATPQLDVGAFLDELHPPSR